MPNNANALFGPNDPGYSADTIRAHNQAKITQIREALLNGIYTAKLAYFGESLVNKTTDAAKLFAVGQAPSAFVEGANTFKPGGTMHWKNVLWPTIPGRPVMQTIGRAGSLLSAAALPSMIKQDTNEGALSRVLGGVGSLAGLSYGGMLGLAGAPIGMAAGRSLGHGIGHLLGSKPRSEYP